MPEYILPRDGTAGNPPVTFDSLDVFTQGYLEALFFTSCSPAFDRDAIASDPAAWETAREEGQSDGDLPGDAGFSDLTPDALATIVADCQAFQRDHAALLAEAYQRPYTAEQAGRDYWYTRNGHGVGYWDRSELEPDSEAWEAAQEKIRAINAAWTDAGDKASGDAWNAAAKVRADLKAESLGERLSKVARHSEVNVYWTDAGQVDL